MRVITGSARGRRLKAPKGADIRPTTDMVKEAVFNIVQYDIEGRRVLDLFAGTGQMGIEALSRGASEVVFVDESRDAVKLVRENLEHCGFEAQVMLSDATSYIERGGRFDLVFIDPPYGSGLMEKCLQKIRKIDILNEGGIIICESSREVAAPIVEEPYYLVSDRSYGKVAVRVYGKRAI